MIRYKAIFFDLDGTLRILTPSPTGAFIDYTRELGYVVDEESACRLKMRAHEYWGAHKQVSLDMERFDEDEFWINYTQLLLQTAGVNHDLEANARAVRDRFYYEYEPRVEMAPGGRVLLQALKEQGYILGLISNRHHPLEEPVVELELQGIFDIIVAAGEVGYWKPDPAIFHCVLQHFGQLQPSQCVYIGDNYFADGHGATAAGLTAILYDPEDLYRDCEYYVIQHMEELLPLLEAA